MRCFLIVSAICCLLTAQAHAALKFTGSGANMQFDVRGFPPQMKTNYEMMKTKCSTCHSLERVVIAFTSGIAPISGQLFDLDSMKGTNYGMFRKSNSGKAPISKEESKAIASAMKYMMEESVR